MALKGPFQPQPSDDSMNFSSALARGATTNHKTHPEMVQYLSFS